MSREVDIQTKALSEIVTINNGIDYKKNPAGNEEIPIYGTGGIMGYTSIVLNEGPAVLSGRKGSINRPFYVEGKFWNVDTIFCLKPIGENNAKWLYYSLLNTDLTKLNEATGVPSVTSKSLYRLKIHYFEPEEQQKISHILTTCDTVIEQTQSAIAKYKAIKQGLLHDLFTRGLDANGRLRPSYNDAPEMYKESELGMVPKEWEVKEFKKLIKSIDSGWSPICLVEPAGIGEWGSLKTTAVTWDGYNPNENKKLPNDLAPRYETEVELDDFLITRVGPRERVGVIVHVDDGRKKLMVSDNMLRIKITKDENLHLPFLALVMGSSFVQKEWIRKIAGLAEAQVVINQQVIRQTIFPLPRINEQKFIFEKINCINKKVHTEETLLQKYQAIKTGLMGDLLGRKKEANTN